MWNVLFTALMYVDYSVNWLRCMWIVLFTGSDVCVMFCLLALMYVDCSVYWLLCIQNVLFTDSDVC